MQLLLGTTNRKKLIELDIHLKPRGFELFTLSDMPNSIEVEESGETFIENARLKAIQQAQHHRLWTVGEDSGLCVPALGGAPGVYSARYSLMDSEQMTPMSSIGKSPERTYIDQLNNAKLLRELNSHPDDKREAYYVSTIALSDPDGKIVIETSGECWGRILREPRGHGGFGYDPLFEVVEYHHTFAELGANVKRAISHRSRALRQFLRQLDNWMPVAKP